MSSPTQRSKAFLEKAGWDAEITEKWIPIPSHPAGGIRRDLFGFGDILAVKDGEPHLIVQTTSQSNVSARVTKILTECADAANRWLRTGGRIVVHGWGKKGPRGKRKLWRISEREVTLFDLDFEARRAHALQAHEMQVTAEDEAIAFVEGR